MVGVRRDAETDEVLYNGVVTEGTPVSLDLGVPYVFRMHDDYGDGWDGAVYTITLNGAVLSTGTLVNNQEAPNTTFVGDDPFTTPPPCSDAGSADTGKGVWIDNLVIDEQSEAPEGCCWTSDDCAGGEGCLVEVCEDASYACVIPPPEVACDDEDPCTADACDLDDDCVHEPIPGCVPP